MTATETSSGFAGDGIDPEDAAGASDSMPSDIVASAEDGVAGHGKA